MRLVAVRFLAPYWMYAAGEVAGFPPEMAEDLVSRGLAELYQATAAEPAEKALNHPPGDKMVRSTVSKGRGGPRDR